MKLTYAIKHISKSIISSFFNLLKYTYVLFKRNYSYFKRSIHNCYSFINYLCSNKSYQKIFTLICLVLVISINNTITIYADTIYTTSNSSFSFYAVRTIKSINKIPYKYLFQYSGTNQRTPYLYYAKDSDNNYYAYDLYLNEVFEYHDVSSSRHNINDIVLNLKNYSTEILVDSVKTCNYTFIQNNDEHLRTGTFSIYALETTQWKTADSFYDSQDFFVNEVNIWLYPTINDVEQIFNQGRLLCPTKTPTQLAVTLTGYTNLQLEDTNISLIGQWLKWDNEYNPYMHFKDYLIQSTQNDNLYETYYNINSYLDSSRSYIANHSYNSVELSNLDLEISDVELDSTQYLAFINKLSTIISDLESLSVNLNTTQVNTFNQNLQAIKTAIENINLDVDLSQTNITTNFNTTQYNALLTGLANIVTTLSGTLDVEIDPNILVSLELILAKLDELEFNFNLDDISVSIDNDILSGLEDLIENNYNLNIDIHDLLSGNTIDISPSLDIASDFESDIDLINDMNFDIDTTFNSTFELFNNSFNGFNFDDLSLSSDSLNAMSYISNQMNSIVTSNGTFNTFIVICFGLIAIVGVFIL